MPSRWGYRPNRPLIFSIDLLKMIVKDLKYAKVMSRDMVFTHKFNRCPQIYEPL